MWDDDPARDVLRPGPWLRARTLAWILVLAAIIFALVEAAPAFAHWSGLTTREDPWIAVVISSLVLGYGAYTGLVRLVERRWPAELDPWALVRDGAYGAAIGAGMFGAVFLILEATGAYSLARGGVVRPLHDLMASAQAALAEELVFRAVVFRLLARALGPVWALVLSAALFGAAHLLNPHANLVAAAAIAVEAGLLLAALYLATGRLWMSVGVHAAWNFTQGFIFGAAVSGHADRGGIFFAQANPLKSDLLTGGAFGPEASLPAMVVGLIVSGVALAVWARGRDARTVDAETQEAQTQVERRVR